MKLFPHFKRRVKDTVQMIKECYSHVTWKNFIWTLPGAIFLTFLISFFKLFEDYDEIDQHNEISKFHFLSSRRIIILAK